MPRIAKTWTDVQIRKLDKDGEFSLGGVIGLYLRNRNGRKSFFYRYTSPLIGKRREITIGFYGKYGCSLEDARLKASEYSKLVKEGLDPISFRNEQQEMREKETVEKYRDTLTFSKLATLYTEQDMSFAQINDKNKDLIQSRLGLYILPKIAQKNANEITPDDIADILSSLWVNQHSLALKVQQILNHIFSWGKAKKYITGENPVNRSVLRHLLPKRPKVEARHHAMLAVSEVPLFMNKLQTHESISARCLEFAILTASRSGNARNALWEEINWANKQWEISAEEMKVSLNGEHIVPLSDQAISLLEKLKSTSLLSRYIFPSPIGNGVLSDASLKTVIQKMNTEDVLSGGKGFVDPKQKNHRGAPCIATPHGIARASFRTWAEDDELGNDKRFNPKIAELCLHHKVTDAYNGAYERNQAMKSRREMMQAWSDYCYSENPKKG